MTQSAPPRTATEPWLTGSVADFSRRSGPHLLDRFQDHQKWWDLRAEHGVDPYSKSTRSSISTVVEARDRLGRPIEGINLGSQDYLSLANHPEVKQAAHQAIERYGVHSAGSAALMGITEEALALEAELAEFLRVKDCTLFPIGWAAGYGIVRTLVQPEDHVLIDQLAHACLQEGARAATQKVRAFRHLSNEDLERRLKAIRANDAHNGILVVTETLFSMDSDVPDLRETQRLAHHYGATLVVDVAHDLGAIGPDGTGFLGLQGLLGQIDVVMGSFSKTFASIGGFVASSHPALKRAIQGLCGPQTFTNAMTPVAAATIRQALRIVQSAEGQTRRARLMANAKHLRQALQDQDLGLLGQPSAIIPTIIGDAAIARLMTREAQSLGGIANLVEFPAVSRSASRWRLQVMADHSTAQLDRFVAIAVEARRRAQACLHSAVPSPTARDMAIG